MTPFDPVALVAMLLAFYPVVGSLALAVARAERPEYFSGGVLFGSKGDKLRLPDGREWDLIANSGLDVSQRRWQALYIDPTAPRVDDPFALEEGPLTPLDEPTPIAVSDGGTFAALLGDALHELGATDDVLASAATAMAEGAPATDLDARTAGLLDDVLTTHAAAVTATDALDPGALLEGQQSAGNALDAQAHEWDEPSPDEMGEGDPGTPPVDLGGGTDSPRPPEQ